MFKSKIKKEGGLKEKPKTDVKNKYLLPGLLSLIIAVVVFVCLLVVEKNALTDYEAVNVLIAKTEVKAGTEITEENIEDLFGQYAVPYMVKGDYVTPSQILNKITNETLYKGTIAVEGEFSDKDMIFKDTFSESSIMATQIDLSVGGDLSTGDFVDIITTDINGNSTTIIKNAYVTKTFSSAGVEATEGVLIANILIPRDNAETFASLVSSGTIRIVKVNISEDDIKEGNISVFGSIEKSNTGTEEPLVNDAEVVVE